MNVEDFLQTPTPITNPEPGMLLLSAPMMNDAFFSRCAIILLPAPKGKMGLILNHELPIKIKDILGAVNNPETMSEIPDIPVFNGGPVDLERLFVIHTLGDRIKGSVRITDGLYVGGESESIIDYIMEGGETEGKMRFVLGYSGWENDQLTKEILENSWTVNPTPDVTELLKAEGEEYWRREVSRLGDAHRSWLSMPHHPSLN